MNNNFQKIYPFTTETISGYINQMNINNKKVLTLGSSCDQALNSLLLGADEVTVFDINQKVQYFYELKRKLILSTSREKMVSEIINNKDFLFTEEIFSYNQLKKMNLYLQNDNNYNKLREILENKSINFINGNIFQIDESASLNKKYDKIILSNVLQYIPEDKNVYSLYEQLLKYAKEDALIQLYYLYGSIFPKGFNEIVDEFIDNKVSLQLVKCDEKDSAVFVKRK